MGRYPHLGPWGAESDRDRRAVRAALERCDVAGFAERPLATLSGGELQRVRIARALAQEPEALVLDEPTAALDVRAEAELYDRFLELTEGLTTILISHRFSTVRRADRIVVLADGAVVEDGSHTQLMATGGRYAEMFTLQAARFADRSQTHA